MRIQARHSAGTMRRRKEIPKGVRSQQHVPHPRIYNKCNKRPEMELRTIPALKAHILYCRYCKVLNINNFEQAEINHSSFNCLPPNTPLINVKISTSPTLQW